MNCPRLVEGTDFAPVGNWPVVLLRDVAAVLPYDLGAIYEFRSGEKLLARHESGTLILKTGFACDGYSPVIRKPAWMPGKDRFIRLTQTPQCGMFPSILHDLTRMFLGVDRCPWTRENTDDWFFDAMVAGRCSDRAGIYHQAVAGTLGTAWINLTRKPDPRLVICRERYRD